MSEASSRFNYLRDGAEIYRRSFATIRAEADLARFPHDEEHVAVRMIHACGMVEIAADLVFSQGAVAHSAARAPARSADPVRFQNARARYYRGASASANEVICTLDDPAVAIARAKAWHHAQRRRARTLARPARWRDRRHRQCADRLVSSARYARRNFRAACLRRLECRSASSARRNRKRR